MSVRVQGETYRSSDELEQEIRELQAARENTPEYGPRRKQLDEHIAALQDALRQLKRQEAHDDDRSGRREASRRQRQQAAHEQRMRQANQRARRGVRSFARGSRRDAGRATGALGLEQPIGGAADLTMTAVGIALALIIVYLLVNERGRGPAAVQGITGALTGTLQRVLNPADPVFFGSAPAAPSAAVGVLRPPAAARPAPRGVPRRAPVPTTGGH